MPSPLSFPAYDLLPIGIWSSNRHGRFRQGNRSFYSLTGTAGVLAEGKDFVAHIRGLIAPQDYEEFQDVYTKAFSERAPFMVECKLRDSNKWTLWQGSPIFNQDTSSAPDSSNAVDANIFTTQEGSGEFDGFVGSVVDVSNYEADIEQRKSELRRLKRRSDIDKQIESGTAAREQAKRRAKFAELSRIMFERMKQLDAGTLAPPSNEFTSSIQQNFSECVLYLDQDQKVRFVSHLFDLWFPALMTKYMGMALRDVLSPKVYELISTPLSKLLSTPGGGPSFEQEAQLQPRFADARTVIAQFAPRVEGDKVIGFVVSLLDVTQTKALEKSIAAKSPQIQISDRQGRTILGTSLSAVSGSLTVPRSPMIGTSSSPSIKSRTTASVRLQDSDEDDTDLDLSPDAYADSPLMPSSLELVCKFELDGKLFFVNDSYSHFFRAREEELIGTSFFALLSAEDREATEQFLQLLSKDDVFGELTPEQKKAPIYHQHVSNGVTRWLKWTIKSVLDSKAGRHYFQGVGFETTERKFAEKLSTKTETQRDIVVWSYILEEPVAIKAGESSFVSPVATPGETYRAIGSQSQELRPFAPRLALDSPDQSPNASPAPIARRVVSQPLVDRIRSSLTAQVATPSGSGNPVNFFVESEKINSSTVPTTVNASPANISALASPVISSHSSGLAASLQQVSWDSFNYTLQIFGNCLELLGHTAQEFQANPSLLDSLVHHEDMQTLKTNRVRQWQGHRTTQLVRFCLPDGKLRWLLLKSTPELSDDKSSLVRIEVVAEDVTKQKHKEESVKLHFDILDKTIAGVCMVRHRDGSIVYTNSSFEKTLGYDRPELRGLHLSKVLARAQNSTADPQVEDGKATYDMLFSKLQERGLWKGELLQKRKGGSHVWCFVQISLFSHASLGLVWTFVQEDITESKEAVRLMREAKEQALQSAAAKSAFLACMSHEIRTPMNGVIGMAKLLADTDLSDDQKEFVSSIIICGDHLLTVINDILDFSKIEGDKLQLEEIPFALHLVVEQAIELAYVRKKYAHLDCVYSIAPGVPLIIQGDPTRLRQILVNLIGNSLKFTARGGVYVTIKPVRTEGNDVFIQFSVTDTGIGIPKDKQGRLFKAFSQVDSSTSRDFGGTGLGLAISYKLACLMHGNMWVESEEGKGAAFCFTVRTPIFADPAPTPGHSSQPSLTSSPSLPTITEAAAPAQPSMQIVVQPAAGAAAATAPAAATSPVPGLNVGLVPPTTGVPSPRPLSPRGKSSSSDSLLQLQNYTNSPNASLQGLQAVVVDDFEPGLQCVANMCKLWGMAVSAFSPEAALDFAKAPPAGANPTIIILDVSYEKRSEADREKEMERAEEEKKKGTPSPVGASSAPPINNGVVIGEALKAKFPNATFVGLLGNQGDNIQIPQGFFAFTMQKPIKNTALLDTLRSCLTSAGAVKASKAPIKMAAPVLSSNFAASHPFKILVAEDNIINQKLFRKVLNKLGYDKEVIMVLNGQEAVDMVKKEKYDVIFMDMQMPVMDGVTATKVIRALNQEDLSANPPAHRYDLHRPYIIAMTANVMEVDKERCFDAGMDDYLSKPIAFEQVQEKLAPIGRK